MKVDEMLAGARDVMAVKRVYGEPIEKDGITIIPAANVRGGGGGGGDSEGNGGGGFGVTARPVGAYVIRNGELSWEPAIDATRLGTLGMVTAIVALLVIRSIAKAIFRKR
jgi:uncharacterized spore protein YtfJ